MGSSGGNVFKDPNGMHLTRRINLREIPVTINWLERLTDLPLCNNTLGSVGKKKSSKDLDLAVDENLITKDDLIKKLHAWSCKQEGGSNQWIKKSGISVHFKTPIAGNAANGYVQTDFMFGHDIEQMKFGLFSAGDGSKFSGADRNLIMSSIAKSLPGDFKYSWQKSLIKRSTGELISKDPDQISTVLLGNGHDRSDLDSIETIAAVIRKDKERLQGLDQLIVRLRSIDNKKLGEIRDDSAEADRITKFMDLVRS